MDHILYDGPYYVSQSQKWTIFAKFAKCVYICMDQFLAQNVILYAWTTFSSQFYIIRMDQFLAPNVMLYVWITF